METLRYNPFHQIHQGLRALLYHTAQSIQQTDFADEKQSTATLNDVIETLHLFESHAHTEDTMVFPIIHKYASAIASDFEEQHVKDHELSVLLEKCIADLNAAATPHERLRAGRSLYFAFMDFVTFNLEHMKQEEIVINKILWDNLTDADLHALTTEIVANIPPEKNMRYSYWMLKGLNTTEITAWFSIIKQTAPPPVFNAFIELAEKALLPQRFVQVQQSLDMALA